MTAQARRDEGSPREVGEAEAGLREERWNRYYVVGGAMRPDAPSYVEREADRQLLEQLLHGEYCYVLTARQMGKSSLMVRAAARLRAAGHRVVLLDLTALGSHTTVEQWYEGLFGYLASQVGGEDELEEFWASQAGLAPLPRFMAALREAASRTPAPREGRYAAPGPEAAGRLFLFLDEIDVVRGLPFSTDEFFAAIREWYNRRAVDPLCEQVTFCFLGVATPADLIQDPQASPFNIGCSIELRDFTLEEAEPLARGLLPPDSARRLPFAEPPFAPRRLLRRILYWTAGHPYLTQRLCLLVSRLPPSGGMGPVAVDRLCRERFLSPGARDRDDNLHFVRDRLLRTAADPAALLELYARIHAGARVSVAEDHPLLDALRLAGIVKPWVGTALGRLLDRSGTARYRVRNRIYAQVFDREWVRRNMPDAERQRQRAAFRQGMLRAGLLAAAVVTALSGATLAALHNAAVARRALAEARRSGAQALQSERVARRALVNARENAARADRDARRADAAEEQERRHRRTAEAASRRATAAGTDALHQARLADAAREQIRRQTVRAYVSAGARADAERDPLTALYWFVEALRLDPADPLPHRRRIATALGRCPRLLRTWGAPGGVWGSVQLSPDGRRVAAVSGAGWLSVWDAPTGRVLFSGLHVPRAAGLLAFDSRGTQVVVGTGSGPNWLCDLSREPVRILRLPGEGPLYSAQFTLDGTSLVVAGSEGTARVFRLGAEHRLLPPLRHGGPIGAGRFSPDGLGVLTGGWDGIGRLWTREGAPLGTALTHPGPIHGAGFAPDGSRILLWGPRSVSVLEAGSGRRLATHGALHVTRVALGPDSRNAVVVRDGLVEFLDLRTGV
ncbi:MAG: hypothetical protein FJX77_04765, partial [Armatimonadetes bacterium]|nr:hypothetical protein [Armatimonadota bacterium]